MSINFPPDICHRLLVFCVYQEERAANYCTDGASECTSDNLGCNAITDNNADPIVSRLSWRCEGSVCGVL